MKIDHFENMISGCFIGDFLPSAYKTDSVEVSYKYHKKGEMWDTHYHAVVTEVNLLIRGKMIIQNVELSGGTIFTLYPFEIANPVFLEDCEIICVKLPGVRGDKIIIEE